jgi:peptide/nickel transport system permease protein
MIEALETQKPVPQLKPKGGESLWSIAWRKFRKHPLARFSLTILSIFYFFAAFADFFAPYPERFLNRDYTFASPTRVHFFDEEGRLTRPFVYGLTRELNLETFRHEWTEDRSQRYPIRFFVRNNFFSPGNPNNYYVPFPINLIPQPLRLQWGIRGWAQLRLFGTDNPRGAPIYIWGADDLGNCVFSKILYGSRISLTIGIIAGLFVLILGMVLGGIAGYFGGWIDEFIMRLEEALSAIPGIFLLLALAAIFHPLRLPPTYVFMLIVTALGVVSWGGIARATRGQILSLKEQEFTYAAKALGAGNWRIILSHLLPNTLSYAIVVLSLLIPGFILTESVLSFYGLGIQPPSTSWGLMLATAQSFAGVSGLAERWWIFIPGLFIFVAVLTWNLVGDGLRDAFDPRSRD